MKDQRMREEYSPQGRKVQTLRLLRYFKPFLGLLAVAVLLALLVNGSILVRPYLLKRIIDDYLVAGIHDDAFFRMMGVIYFAIVLFAALFAYLQTYLLTFIGQRIMYRIRSQLFAHIQGLSMGFFDRNSSGRILTRVTNDVEALNELFSGVIIHLFRDLILIIGIVAVMFLMDPGLALISISTIPLIFLTTILYRRAARVNFVRVKALISRINGFLAENISGMKLVQIFNRQREKYAEFKELDTAYFRCSLREVILNSLCRPIVDIINHLAVAVLIWFCLSRVYSGTLELGVLFAFITYIRQFFEPISELSERYTSIQSAFISSERIFDILDNQESLEDIKSGMPAPKLRGEIEFRKVWFAYNEEEWVLEDVSFHIRPGETAAFVGATGSGKSTIIGLMARFYDIQRGEILIDNIPIQEYNLKDLRRQIAVVLQDVFLFSGTVKSNIRLNNTDIKDEEILDAVEFVNADRFVSSLPGGLEEEVKERGCTFSSGQRQLISFARAVAFNPSILVLDEATANIDTETEAAIQQGMVNLSKDRTSIIIAHRLSTIRNADKIMVIHQGRILEMGRHADLMQRKGLYYQLCQKQILQTAALSELA